MSLAKKMDCRIKSGNDALGYFVVSISQPARERAG
jgi:hypothetical protein